MRVLCFPFFKVSLKLLQCRKISNEGGVLGCSTGSTVTDEALAYHSI